MEETMPENRRSTTRFDVSLPANLDIGECSHALTITNLSLGGAFVDYVDKIALGTQVSLKFEIPGRTSPISVGARVRWVADSGAGVQFDGLRAGEVWSLNQYLSTLGGNTKDTEL